MGTDARRYHGAFFGEPWPAGVCEDGHRLPTPVGVACALCGDVVDADGRGTWFLTATGPSPVHRECSLRSVLGGIGHHEDHAFWCQTIGDPDGGRSFRESALAVYALVESGKLGGL